MNKMWYINTMGHHPETAMEWSTDTFYSMSDPCKHAMRKKPVTKDHILHDSVPVTCPERGNLCRQKVDYHLVGIFLSGNRGRRMVSNGHGLSF